MGLSRRSLRRWPIVAAIGVVLLISLAGVASAIGSRRHAEMRAAGDLSQAAVSDARAADAMTWAADELLTAERTWREALTAQRVEEARLWPIPDSVRVATAHAAAGRAAKSAEAIAVERRTTASNAARSLMDAATAAVSASETLATTIHLDTDRRTLLARARGALLEARVYEREGDFGLATVRARQATDLAALVRDHAAAVAARYADAETIVRWRRWKDETVAWSRREGRAAIVVSKEAHTLTLFVRGRIEKTYKIDLGFNWIADKKHAGDGATPEGRYRVVTRKANGASVYHKALLLDYPNVEDQAEFSRARRAGAVPASAGIGSLIEIHGEGGRGRDWTRGCVALTNPDIDDLWSRVGVGTPVTIVGSDEYGAIAEFAVQQRSGAGAREP